MLNYRKHNICEEFLLIFFIIMMKKCLLKNIPISRLRDVIADSKKVVLFEYEMPLLS